ncbi:MAG: hypothetical protein GY798_29750 [Hyphomicrobiales bacterium]|nr:hypothetical protein [Hyphomicrobiales bacterium]
MSSEYNKFRISLLRRFQAAGFGKGRLRQITQASIAGKSFAIDYLLSISSNVNHETLDVVLTKAALEVAREDGRQAALKVADQFARFTESTVAKRAILADGSNVEASYEELYDRFLFYSPLSFNGGSREKRSCYEEALDDLNIPLPFDRKGMQKLLQALDPEFQIPKVRSFDDLSDFIWDLVSSVWPLFDASILFIPLSYFKFDDDILVEEMRSHLDLMRGYGFERLLGRLIVLQAICGSCTARRAVLESKALEYCRYSKAQMSQLERILTGRNAHVSRECIGAMSDDNPIERATYLALYLQQSRFPFEFLERITEIYETDETVLRLLNWEQFLKLIEGSVEFLTPELVGMASILSLSGALDRSPTIKSLYVPTGANTDLLNYAKHCRENKGMSAYQFFRSFSKLPPKTQKAVFTFLLEPGVMDTIVNVFPSSSELIEQVDRNDAVNALSLKLDCIAYLKKKRIIAHSDLDTIEESTRQRVRQVKYETETSSGRIRLNKRKFADLVFEFVCDSYEFRTENTLVEIHDREIRTYLENRWNRRFAAQAADFICFRCRFALDYLLSNLRHNFLRFKLESAIDAAFHGQDVEQAPLFKSIITDPLDEYCEDWLTISSESSFFDKLVGDIYQILSEFDPSKDEGYRHLSDKISTIAIKLYEQLLTECREAWTSNVKLEITKVVEEKLNSEKYGSNTALREALIGELEKAFMDTEGWLSVNDSPLNSEFGLRELFIFESTNFSTAKTRRKPVSAHCYKKSTSKSKAKILANDVIIPGELFDAMVLLVQNLLENAFQYSGLPAASTAIDVEIIDCGMDGVTIRFKNNFDTEKRTEVKRLLREFNKRLREAENEANQAPLHTGGSGLKRIYFELFSVFGSNFDLRADGSEIRKGTFLVVCSFPNGEVKRD